MTSVRPSDYWFSPTAVYIQLNAAGDPNYIHANCSAGSMVMCYMRNIPGLGYDNAHNYRRWPLVASPTVFHDNDTRYVYIAIPRSESVGSSAMVVFPSQIIDLYGRDADNQQVGSADYYYIDTQGVISASSVGGVLQSRSWLHDIDCGKLASDEAIAAGGEGSWWEWNAATDMVRFLKVVSSARFRELFADFADIAQLKLDGSLLNSVAVPDGSDPTPVSASDAVVTPAYLKQLALSRISDDIAKGRISFEQGAAFGQYIQSAAGASVDAAGNAEVESIVVRSFMKVYELIYNRINALEGTTSFSDSGTIESVSPNGALFDLTMRKRWDLDFTSFQPGDIIYGYVNDLAASGVYYKCWMLVASVDRAANILTVSLYPDSEVPAGRNFPPTAEMVVSRWGNAVNPSAEALANPDYASFVTATVKNGVTRYLNTRQTSFFISCEDGNIVELMGVDRPILGRSNYGAVLGQLPAGLLPPDKAALINDGQPYLYARGIVVQDLIRIDYEGRPVREDKYRGLWSIATAQNPDNYYRNDDSRIDSVSHDGRLWQCVANGNTDTPGDDNGSWLPMTGLPDVVMWSIIPSSNIVNIRRDADGHEYAYPASLSCSVRRDGSDGPVSIDRAYDLLLAGAVLFYSLDGVNWSEFAMGVPEPLELEDSSGYIEAEASTEAVPDIFIVGGDDIDTDVIDDRILFELRDAESSAVLASAMVPVVKDGVFGADGVSYEVSISRTDFLFRKGSAETVKCYVDAYVNGVNVLSLSGFRLEVDPPSGSINTNLRYTVGTESNGRVFIQFYYYGGEFSSKVLNIEASICCNDECLASFSKSVSFVTVKDGRDGLMAYPAGEFDPDFTYSATGETTPVVFFDGEYYVLKQGCSYTGSAKLPGRDNPRDDYLNGGSSSFWRIMDRFNSIFADIVFAEFAKLGSAVFFKDWMISQQGTIGDAPSSDYVQFKSGAFSPNFSLNFSTGELIALMGKFAGELNASSGRLGNLRFSGNFISGYDASGNERVRIGLGDLPSVDSAFVSRQLPFSLSSDVSDAVILDDGIEGKYAQRIGSCQQDTDDMLISAVCEFSVSDPMISLSFDGIALSTVKIGGSEDIALVTQSAVLSFRADSESAFSNVATAHGNQLGRDSKWSVPVSGAGQYRLKLSGHAYTPNLSDWRGLLQLGIKSVVATFSPSSGDLPNCTTIAQDGIFCSQGSNKYMRFSESGGFEVRIGGYGFRVSESGFAKLAPGNAGWQSVSL